MQPACIAARNVMHKLPFAGTCDYGNRYCMGCASIARQAARKRALARYQGRLNHAVRQSRYRERKKVTHKGSSTLRFSVPLTDGPVKIKLPSIPQARK